MGPARKQERSDEIGLQAKFTLCQASGSLKTTAAVQITGEIHLYCLRNLSNLLKTHRSHSVFLCVSFAPFQFPRESLSPARSNDSGTSVAANGPFALTPAQRLP